jgi:large subunit ribosomal protein L29
MKTEEIRELSVADIQEKIEDMTEQQNKLILAHSVSQLENPVQIRANRKTIARLKTELNVRNSAVTAEVKTPVAKKAKEEKVEEVKEAKKAPKKEAKA